MLILHDEITTEIRIKRLNTYITLRYYYDNKHIFIVFYHCFGSQWIRILEMDPFHR